MKIIHCADLHLDSRMETFLTPEQAAARRQELLYTFMQMARYADKIKARAVLIAGDFFDRESVSASTIHTVCDEIASHSDVEFFFLRGNHDPDDAFSSAEQLPENLRFFDNNWTYYDFPDSPVVICGAQAGGTKLGQMSDLLELDPSDFNIVMLHGQTADVYRSPEDDLLIPAAALRNRGIDYLALGHLHSFRKDTLDTRGISCYPGCLEGRGFDECGPHGFVILDIDTSDHTFDLSFVPFASRILRNIRVDVGSCQSQADILQAVLRHPEFDKANEKDLVRITLVGDSDPHSEMHPEFLRSDIEREKKFYYLEVKDSTVPNIDYNYYRLDSSLKGEFVRQVESDPALSDKEKAEIIRCGFRALAGEDL